MEKLILQQQLQMAFAPFEAFATTSDLRHATLYPADPGDGLTPLLVQGVVGRAPFRRITYPNWRAEMFYGRLEDDYRAFTDAALAIMDCIRQDWPDGNFGKWLAGHDDYAPEVWMHLLYHAIQSDESPSPLLQVDRGQLLLLHDGVILEGGGQPIKLADDDERWGAAREIAGHDRHQFIKSRRNVFLLTRYAIETFAIENTPPPGTNTLSTVWTVGRVAARVEVSEHTIRRAMADAEPEVPKGKPGNDRRLDAHEIGRIARARKNVRGFGNDEREKWSELLAEVGDPGIDEPLPPPKAKSRAR